MATAKNVTTENKIDIVTNTENNVTVTQPSIQTVEILTGPQGATGTTGAIGPAGPTGSLNLSSSLGSVNIVGILTVTGSSIFTGSIIVNLPTTEPTITGSLWLSGSSAVNPNSSYLMVFNP